MSSSEAGPSTAPPKQVPLSVEPVHIYTDPNPASSGSGSIERERQLQDVLADGTNVFTGRKPASQQLGEDVRRLWSERGDFSRFRTSELLRKRSLPEDVLSSSDDDEEEDGAAQGKGKGEGEEDEEEGILRKPGQGSVGGTIGESEFIKLRNRVLASLDVAHFNSIHAHQLLGMLIKQHRSTTTATSSSSTAAGVAGRMASPAPSVGAQSNRSGSTNTAPNLAQKAPLGIFSHLTHPSNREEEFILDPLSIALSRTSLNSSTAARRDISADADQEEEEEEEYEDPTSSSYGIRQAKRELEGTTAYKADRLREFKVVLETKRKGIRNAAELLSGAAEELRQSQGANRERWRALIGLHGRGWGLTPGRPLLDVERFGVSTNAEEEEGEEAEEVKGKDGGKAKEKKEGGKKERARAAGLQGFGTPILTSDGKVKEESARDAWIGFGLPEAPIELRRRSVAYWADTSSSSTTGAAAGVGARVEEVKQKLVFPDRMHRRLRVRFVLWPRSPSTADDKIQWSSDPPSSGEDENKAGKIMGQVLDSELQAASREASDELSFGDVVAQARLLPPTFGVRLTPSSVRIVLTKRLDMVVELVSTTADSEEEGGGKQEVRFAPYASLLLAFLRLGPLRKYMAFVTATREGRKIDAPARASVLKAVALAVPKKSIAAGGGAKGEVGSGAGGGKVGGSGGIAAGGKATSLALGKLESLGPILVGLHYWSFVYRLGSLLQRLQQRVEREKGLTVRVQLVPVTPSAASSPAALGRLEDLSSSLARMMDAVPGRTTAKAEEARGGESALHSIYTRAGAAQGGKADVLKGYAKVYVEQGKGAPRRLVCTLSFAQPSLLTVQFTSAGSGRKEARVKLTNKPLSVDLDTLGTLLTQYIS